MNERETATEVYALRNEGATFEEIGKKLDITRDRCWELWRMDLRQPVQWTCKDCGVTWSALLFPWQNYSLHRCVSCAAMEWQNVVARESVAA